MKKIKILMVFIVFLFLFSFAIRDIGYKQIAYEAQMQNIGRPSKSSNSKKISTNVGSDIASKYGQENYDKYVHDITNPMEIVDNALEAFGPNGYLMQ